MSRLVTALEPFDDGHVSAAAWPGRQDRVLMDHAVLIDDFGSGLRFRRRDIQQFTGARRVLGLVAAGQQTVMTDAVESVRHDMPQEAAEGFRNFEAGCRFSL